MKRQNDVFFDTDAWEKDREAAFEREQMGGGKKKKITKSDVVRVLFFCFILVGFMD